MWRRRALSQWTAQPHPAAFRAPQVADLVSRCTSLDPLARPTAQQLVQELGGLLGLHRHGSGAGGSGGLSRLGSAALDAAARQSGPVSAAVHVHS